MADEPLLLGLPDGNMEENDDKICGWSTNKIGGTPNWLFGQPSNYPTCPLCNNLLYLVCQIYCPLANSVFHRVLYIFGCVNVCCWNENKSWKVLRAQAKDSNFVLKEATENQSFSRFQVDDWCDDAEDWGDSHDVMSSELEELAGKLKLAEDKPDKVHVYCKNALQVSTSEQVKEMSPSCVPNFAPLYISVIEAPDTRGTFKQMTEHEKILLADYEKREGLQFVESMECGNNVRGWAGEKYESEAVTHGDKAFHKFHKQLQSCPQQCLRYQWNGLPVSMVTSEPSKLCSTVPPCQHCGAKRVFEVQFMPALVGHLKVAQDLRPKNIAQENETVIEQFTQENNKCDLQSLNNSLHAETGEILTEDTIVQQKLRKTFMAAVNQKCDATIEFGTVIVFTCSKSCWTEIENVAGQVIYFEEFCVVEADPDATLFE